MLYSKDVRLPIQLQRAMAAEAEATREAKAKVRLTRNCSVYFHSYWESHFYGHGMCSYRVRGVGGSCADHLTVESYTIIISLQSYLLSHLLLLVFHHPLTLPL